MLLKDKFHAVEGARVVFVVLCFSESEFPISVQYTGVSKSWRPFLWFGWFGEGCFSLLHGLTLVMIPFLKMLLYL